MEKTACEAMRKSGSSAAVALSASSTTRMLRRRAASQIGRTNCGYRLSARTRSAAVVIASGSRGATVAILLSRYVTIVRSPRASTKIAESPVDSPSTRWHALVSMLSRARAASTRSPLSSLPAGPPSGLASIARPPSRAIATAAFAAQPPLTMKKSSASTLVSGCGMTLTRKTSSSTRMPAHKMRGAAAPLAENGINGPIHRGRARRRRG